jgi:cytochrome c553
MAVITRWETTVCLLTVASLLSGISTARADDLMVGASIATQGTGKGVPACITCHGSTGAGNTTTGFPRLAGIDASYLSAQLNAFADGTRQNSTMQPFARLLSVRDRQAVATYFASLSSLKVIDNASPQPSNVGAWIATRGRWEQGLPACAQCHGPGGVGVGSVFPPLAGQPASYIANQMHGWKNGIRPPGPMALMLVVASKLSDVDITAVAAYYAEVGGKAANGTASNGSKK